MHTLLLEAWKRGTLFKKVLVCHIKVFQGLLPSLRVRFGKKGRGFFFFPFRQKPCSFVLPEAFAFGLVSLLFQGKRLVPPQKKRQQAENRRMMVASADFGTSWYLKACRIFIL